MKKFPSFLAAGVARSLRTSWRVSLGIVTAARSVAFALLALLIGTWIAPPSLALTSYTFKPIEYPNAYSTFPEGINNAGQIVGWYLPENPLIGGLKSRGFLYVNGQFTEIHFAGADSTRLLDLNDDRTAVGSYTKDGNSHGIIYSIGSQTFTTWDAPGASSTLLHGINNLGNRVGVYEAAGKTHGLIFDRGSNRFATLDYPQANSTILLAINDANQIVGQHSDQTGLHGLRYDLRSIGPTGIADGAFTLIPPYRTIDEFNLAQDTIARGINDAGTKGFQLVGSYNNFLTNQFLGFLLTGAFFADFNFPQARNTFPRKLNDHGQIVGGYCLSSAGIEGCQEQGFLASPFYSTATAAGANTRISPTDASSGDDTEPAIAVDPNNPDHLIAAAIDVQNDSCRYFASFDGGSIWSGGSIDIAGFSGCTDPSVAFDRNGSAFFCGFFFKRASVCTGDNSTHCTSNNSCTNAGGFCNYGFDFPTTKVGVAVSTDGGLTFGSPVAFRNSLTSTEAVDKTYLAVDNSGSVSDGTLYVGFSIVNGRNVNLRKIAVGISVDHGATFRTAVIAASGNNYGAHPAVGPDGEVYISWRQFDDPGTSTVNEDRIQIARSTNQGLNWNTFTVANLGPQNSLASVPGISRTTRYPIVGVSHGGGTRGNVYVCFADDPTTYISQDIWVARSSDQGATWQPPVRVNDVLRGDQFDPWMGVAPNGRIDFVWIDRRDDPANMLYHIYFSTSLDGAQSFTTNVLVTDRPSDPRLASLKDIYGNGFIGDYIGLVSDDAGAHLVWPDFRDGKQEIYIALVDYALLDHGDGTITDPSTGLMWLRDANYAKTSGADADGAMIWADAVRWADGLVFAGYSDWRLPRTLYPDLNCRAGATPFIGIDCTGSELGYLRYVRGLTPSAPGPFINVRGRGLYYWSGTEFNAARAWAFQFYSGEMGSGNKPSELYSWAVREVKPSDTSVGPGSQVNPHPDISLTFADVDGAGATTVVESAANPGGGNFQFLGNFYDLKTTAAYTPPVTICFSYDDPGLPPVDEAALQILHLENGTWVSIPITSRDLAGNILCGTVSSFSWFGVARSQGPIQPRFRRGDASSDGMVDITDAIVIFRYLFLGDPAPECFDAMDANDDGDKDISDGIAILRWRFIGGAAPPDPGPTQCGTDPTADHLPVCVYTKC